LDGRDDPGRRNCRSIMIWLNGGYDGRGSQDMAGITAIPW
jgi:hypothetical protein